MRQWSILTGLAALLVLAGGFMLLVKPARHNAASLRAKAASQNQNNNMLQNDLAVLRAEQRDEPKNQAELAAIAAKIPNNPGLPSLIRSLSSAADDAGVELVSISPSAPTTAAGSSAAVTVPQHPSGSASSGATGATATQSLPYATIQVQLQVNCPFFQCEQFLSELESLSRAFLVTGFTATPLGSGPAAGTSTAQTGTSSGTAAPTSAPGTLNLNINGDVFMSTTTAATNPTTAGGVVSPAAPAK